MIVKIKLDTIMYETRCLAHSSFLPFFPENSSIPEVSSVIPKAEDIWDFISFVAAQLFWVSTEFLSTFCILPLGYCKSCPFWAASTSDSPCPESVLPPPSWHRAALPPSGSASCCGSLPLAYPETLHSACRSGPTCPPNCMASEPP